MTTYYDGIYFGMSEDDYHAIPRLSGSALKQLCVSPGTFWVDSWMNPDREDRTSSALDLGKAYHAAALEPDELYQRFYRAPAPSDMPEGSLMNDTDVKAALAELGEPQTKKGENALTRAQRLVSLGCTTPIYSITVADASVSNRGRTPLAAATYDQMQRDLRLLYDTPEIGRLFEGGAAEVVILFKCPMTGEPMKARLDYLTTDGIREFKTFSNSRRARLDQAVSDAVRYERYYLSAELYVQAVEAMKANPGDVDAQTDEQERLVEQLTLSSGTLPFTFIFQETGGAPNVLARSLKLRGWHDGNEYLTALAARAQMEIRHAVSTFRHCCDVYGTEGVPWQPLNMTGTLDDSDFNTFWLDGDHK